MAVESIAKTLGTGSGIDITSLVTQLVDAQYANKNEQLTAKSEALTKQISALAEIKSGITGFASALAALTKGGTLTTQPTSSNTGILTVAAKSGASLAGLSGSLEVRQLASAQVAYAAPVQDKTAPIGTGTLTIRFGTATVEDGAMTEFTQNGGTAINVTIDAANSSLDKIAAKINAAGLAGGLTASVLTDADGSRLVLKTATGAARAFTITATEDPAAPGLAALNVGVGATGTTIGSAAQDAVVAVDGVALKRSSNSISDLIDGVTIDLVSAAPGTKVSLGSSAPTAALGQAVSDVVDTFNQLYTLLKNATDPVNGPLKSDPAAKSLMRSLRELTTQTLLTGQAQGTPTSLSGIGVATQRDGTLTVNTTQLAKALVNYPRAVEAMFSPTGGLVTKLNEISTAAASKSYGLGASETRYTKAQADIADDQAEALEKAEALRTRMTQQFASMDAKVAAYKSTQTFLQQQVDAWNSND